MLQCTLLSFAYDTSCKNQNRNLTPPSSNKVEPKATPYIGIGIFSWNFIHSNEKSTKNDGILYDSHPGSEMTPWFPSRVGNHALVPFDLGNGITFRFPSMPGNSLLIPIKGRESSNRVSYPPCSHMGAAHIIGMISSPPPPSVEINSRQGSGIMQWFSLMFGIMLLFLCILGFMTMLYSFFG